MSRYHVTKDRFDRLPERIIVREDGYMDAYKNYGEPIIDYVYTLSEKRNSADELNAALGRGTCQLEETESYSSEHGTVHVLECSNCGRECEHVNGDYEHCPHCLARNELF